MYARPEVFVVTSNWNPREIWTDPHSLAPIERRFKVICFKYDDEDVTKYGNEYETRSRPRPGVLPDAHLFEQIPEPVTMVPGFNPPDINDEFNII